MIIEKLKSILKRRYAKILLILWACFNFFVATYLVVSGSIYGGYQESISILYIFMSWISILVILFTPAWINLLLYFIFFKKDLVQKYSIMGVVFFFFLFLISLIQYNNSNSTLTFGLVLTGIFLNLMVWSFFLIIYDFEIKTPLRKTLSVLLKSLASIYLIFAIFILFAFLFVDLKMRFLYFINYLIMNNQSNITNFNISCVDAIQEKYPNLINQIADQDPNIAVCESDNFSSKEEVLKQIGFCLKNFGEAACWGTCYKGEAGQYTKKVSVNFGNGSIVDACILMMDTSKRSYKLDDIYFASNLNKQS